MTVEKRAGTPDLEALERGLAGRSAMHQNQARQ
jgi:hypothetical protein